MAMPPVLALTNYSMIIISVWRERTSWRGCSTRGWCGSASRRALATAPWLQHPHKLRRHALRQPHPIGRAIKQVPGGAHRRRIDREDYRLAVPRADAPGGFGVTGQVHM